METGTWKGDAGDAIPLCRTVISLPDHRRHLKRIQVRSIEPGKPYGPVRDGRIGGQRKGTGSERPSVTDGIGALHRSERRQTCPGRDGVHDIG